MMKQILTALLLTVHVGEVRADFALDSVQKLVANDGVAYDEFGRSLSLSADGSIVLIGAPGDDDKGSASGTAYVFVRASDGSWMQKQKLMAADGAAGDNFGSTLSLSADGGTALVGAKFDDDKGSASGAAYVFVRASDGSWMQKQKLMAADGATGDNFGSTLSLSADGGTAIIGSPGAAAAYIFAKTGNGAWVQKQKLVVNEGGSYGFGDFVSLSGDGGTALVMVPYWIPGANKAVYVFIRGTDGLWVQKQALIPPPYMMALEIFFSSSLSLAANGSIALIGGGEGSAEISVFVRSTDGTWEYKQTLSQSDMYSYYKFGGAVSLSADGNTALIQKSNTGLGFDSRDKVYVYSRGSDGFLTEKQQLIPTDVDESEHFGNAISLSANGTIALIGCALDKDRGTSSGSAYIFTQTTKTTTVPSYNLLLLKQK